MWTLVQYLLQNPFEVGVVVVQRILCVIDDDQDLPARQAVDDLVKVLLVDHHLLFFVAVIGLLRA
jgi:hypothetical protein